MPRTIRALAVLTLLGSLMAGCGGGGTDTTAPAATTTTRAPETTVGTTAGQTLRHLRDGDVMSQDDLNGVFAIVHGDRAELRLSNAYTWTEPEVAGPAELNVATPPAGADYSLWEFVTTAPGNVVISATGAPNCDDCGLDELQFAASIAVRHP